MAIKPRMKHDFLNGIGVGWTVYSLALPVMCVHTLSVCNVVKGGILTLRR